MKNLQIPYRIPYGHMMDFYKDFLSWETASEPMACSKMKPNGINLIGEDFFMYKKLSEIYFGAVRRPA